MRIAQQLAIDTSQLLRERRENFWEGDEWHIGEKWDRPSKSLEHQWKWIILSNMCGENIKNCSWKNIESLSNYKRESSFLTKWMRCPANTWNILPTQNIYVKINMTWYDCKWFNCIEFFTNFKLIRKEVSWLFLMNKKKLWTVIIPPLSFSLPRIK